MWIQKEIHLESKSRGFHLITDEILRECPELHNFKIGMMNIFSMHTSVSLTINVNDDPTVRQDFESYFNRSVPENEPYYLHQHERPDDLPAHLKSSLLGCSLNIPIASGLLKLGALQGIYLCEHRNQAGIRRLNVTIQGE
jgi:secondary thiamine-phosphate synthase enzyme